MTHLPLDAVQTALLFDDLEKMPSKNAFFSFVVANLNNALAEKTGIFVAVNAPDGGGFGLIANPQNDLHITVELMETPLAQSGFEPVTAASFYRTHHPELVEAVMSHTCAVLVGVGLGTTPFPLDHPLISQLGMAKELGGDQDQAKFETRLLILQTLSDIICGMSKPTVVHWSQSSQLFEPAMFSSLAKRGFCLPLYICCGAHSFGEKIGDSYKVGIKGFGSQHLIGHFVHFDTDPRPFRKSYATVMAFVEYCRQIGRVLDHGETFQEPDGDVISVQHFTTPDIPLPQIMLSLHGKGQPKPVSRAPTDRSAPPAGFSDLRQVMKGEGRKSSGPATPKVDRPRPATAAETSAARPTPSPRATGADRLRQAMQQANTGATPHSLKAALAETAQTVGPGAAAEPAPSAPTPALGTGDTAVTPDEGPTDWIKDHVFDGGSKTNTMQGRIIKVLIACACLYVIVQVVGPMTDVLSINTLN